MRVSSFKAQYRQAPPRAGTPPPPIYEPLSPILRPLEPSAANPAGGKDNTATHDSNRGHFAKQHTPTRRGAGRAPLQLDTPSVTYEPPLRSAPLPRPNPQYSPAPASPIDALANAAVSSLQASPAYLDTSRRPSHVPVSPTTVAPRVRPSDRASKHAYTESAAFSHQERPSKRARSEFYGSPQQLQYHPRPATSHIPGWSYNVEQMVDNGMRMYQDNSAPAYNQEDTQSKRLSDAQLLLDFHNAVSASYSVKPHASTAKRWSISHPEASDPHAAPNDVEITNPYLGAQHLAEKPLNQPAPSKKGHDLSVPEPTVNASPTENPIVPAVQTHTPPEDVSAITLAQTKDTTSNVEGKKSKKHQGVSKNKARGSRTGTGADKKKRSTPKPKSITQNVTSSTTDQLHSPQSLPANEPEVVQLESTSTLSTLEQKVHPLASQARRKSHSNASLPTPHNLNLISLSSRAQSAPLEAAMMIPPPTNELDRTRDDKENDPVQTTICAGCNSSDSVTSIGDGEQWISCDGCKGWFHYSCAGFKSEREVREIDKFYCDACTPKFGNTTKVRKSARAHTTVDYAGLNMGILKTSDDNPEHHYIQAFKNGDLEFTAETFARIPPECVTADFFEKMNGFTEPVVIPADLNPRPTISNADISASSSTGNVSPGDDQYGYEMVPDDGQDKIDMVIPEGLTVRRVSELYGPNETVPVIDVKAQEGEDKRWTMAKWADYYEQSGEKPVRNVISLEVSRSKLGRLIRRPKAVRNMDLQDSVWPEDDKLHAPPVQFYCLMSVADCYTDFHIDFGGSSVYYHIIKGQKTFFFIRPTKQNLKKYEDWCLSPKQSQIFLGQQVKECYRVDLFPGDTMLIPSGWIHAVWTPEDSLVIGGNYLTRIHYGMQIKILEIEKNTKVAPKFRYPFFQKIMWLTLIKYLEEDPLPKSVEELLLNGEQFPRTSPIYCEPDKFGHNSDLGPENYNMRYYPKAELEGLPDLVNYIWRTVMISQGRIEGITQQTRNAVTRSIPKGHGEPSTLARRFAMWIAWKRGNESIPSWAHPDASTPETADLKGEKKLSAAQVKKMERESWNETLKLVRGGERHSSLRARVPESSPNGEIRAQAGEPMTGFLRPHREHITTPKTSQLGPKRIACDACRKRRIRCKHKDDLVETSYPPLAAPDGLMNVPATSLPSSATGGLTARRYSDADIPSTPLPFVSPLYDTQGTMNGGPVSADLNTDALANKSGRVKACADCRKSKRRCIHDEYGNVDPIKAAETPVPRGSASKKRRTSDEVDGEALSKKMKRESFAGLVNGEVSHWNRYPLAKPRSAESTESPPDATNGEMDQTVAENTAPEDSVPIDPQLSEGFVDTIMATTPSHPISRDTVVPSIEDHMGEPMDGVTDSAPIDPQLLDPEPRTPASTSGMFPGEIDGVSEKPSQFLLAPISNTSPEQKVIMAQPASTTPNLPRSRLTTTPSKTPHALSRKSITPRSTPKEKCRQDSKDSVKFEALFAERPRAMSSTESNNEDMASLALALQLQMEEHGLRRRSK